MSALIWIVGPVSVLRFLEGVDVAAGRGLIAIGIGAGGGAATGRDWITGAGSGKVG
jgi:hypothetical protein